LAGASGFKLQLFYNFNSKICFNSELGSGAMRHQFNQMHLKCMLMLHDHTSTPHQPLAGASSFKLQLSYNFGSKIWFNLELGSAAMGHQGYLMHQICLVPMGAEPSFKLNQMFVAKFREILPMFAI
jgi:hypothetical protein